MVDVNYLILSPETPIRIGELKTSNNFLTTKEYIPGSVIRGALTQYLILQGRGDEISDFIKSVRFGSLYPSILPNMLSYPLPLTCLTCKFESGFMKKNGNKDDEGHGVFDALIPSIAYYVIGEGKFYTPLLFKCPKCGSRMDKYFGIYVKNEEYSIVEVKKFFQTKVGISRRRGVSQKGILYSIAAINPSKIYFIGRIYGEEDKISVVKDALNEVGVGAHTAKGFGKVRAEIRKNIRGEISLKSRLEKFNEKLKEVVEDLKSICWGEIEEDDLTYFSVDLISPAIIRENLIPTLKLKIKIENTVLEPVLFASQPYIVTGWMETWGLPKEACYAACIGSTYVYRVNKDVDELADLLNEIEVKGVGEKTDEGFGEVLICHPFHMEVKPV